MSGLLSELINLTNKLEVKQRQDFNKVNTVLFEIRRASDKNQHLTLQVFFGKLNCIFKSHSNCLWIYKRNDYYASSKRLVLSDNLSDDIGLILEFIYRNFDLELNATDYKINKNCLPSVWANLREV